MKTTKRVPLAPGEPMPALDAFLRPFHVHFARSEATHAGHVHDPGQDCFLLEDVPDGPDAALPEDEFQPVRHADGLEETLLADAVGQRREVAHVPAVPVAHIDVSDLDFNWILASSRPGEE
jgi:hypothetical protein